MLGKKLTMTLLAYFNASLLQTDMGFPKTVCALPLGMEKEKIPDSAIVASSRYNDYYGPERGRLNNLGKCFLWKYHRLCDEAKDEILIRLDQFKKDVLVIVYRGHKTEAG